MENLKIYSDPPMEITSMAEVSSFFRSGGKLAFSFSGRSRKLFVKHTKRLNHLERKRRAQKNTLSIFRYRIYHFYLGILEIFTCWNQPSLQHAFLIYSAFICDIASFKGENLSEDSISVTYNGRTENSNNISRNAGTSTGFDWSEK